jgi:hypothetical protein
MYNIKSIKIFLFAFVLVSFSACFRDQEIFNPYEDVSHAWSLQQKFPLNISGQIFDEQNNPIENVRIKVAYETVTTDKNGFFALKNVTENPLHTYIQVEKSGFFKGSRVMTCSKNANNVVKIVLLKKEKIATFNSDKSTNVNVGKAKIAFSRNSFLSADGKPYIGNVNVEAKYLDPSKSDTYFQMPGNLQGITEKGEDRVLGTYGMVVCELTDDSGKLINLNPDSTATITFPRTAKFQEDQKIVPLWHFDEKVGTWREEGFSTLIGNDYVGKVHHFSFWNCDYPFPYVNFKTTLKDENGNPLQGTVITLCFKKDSLGVNTGYGYTNKLGEAEGKIPKDQVMTLKIIDPICGKVLFTQQVGPYTSDVDLPISVNLPNLPSLIYKANGKLQDCNLQPVKNGYAQISVYLKSGKLLTSTTAATDSLGNFSTTIFDSKCYNSIDIEYADVKAVDFLNKKEGTATKVPLQKGNNDFGTLVTCSNLSDYMEVDINGKTILMTKVYSEGNLYLNGSSDTSKINQTFFYLNFQNLPANPPLGVYSATIPATMLFGGKAIVITQNNLIPVNFTKFPAVVGDYYEGVINPVPSVILLDQNGNNQKITGKFKIKKQ